MFQIPQQKTKAGIPLDGLCTSTCFRFAGLIYGAKKQDEQKFVPLLAEGLPSTQPPPVQPVWVSPPHAGVPRAALRNASPLAPVICGVSGSWGGDGVYLHTSPLLSFYVSMPQNMILGKQAAFLIRYLHLFLHEIPVQSSVP